MNLQNRMKRHLAQPKFVQLVLVLHCLLRPNHLQSQRHHRHQQLVHPHLKPNRRCQTLLHQTHRLMPRCLPRSIERHPNHRYSLASLLVPHHRTPRLLLQIRHHLGCLPSPDWLRLLHRYFQHPSLRSKQSYSVDFADSAAGRAYPRHWFPFVLPHHLGLCFGYFGCCHLPLQPPLPLAN